MIGKPWTYNVHLHGALSFDAKGAFVLPEQAALVEISATCMNFDTDSHIIVSIDSGPPTRDGILQQVAIGELGSPARFTPTEFDGELCDGRSPYSVEFGAIVIWELGFGSIPPEDIDLVFTFLI
ncbi:MAG: hypothetical protein GY753_12760 [Gammaproteobacteria bacterium]|nr:hypothetical protein [Gammaproteobacteria bacterium]